MGTQYILIHIKDTLTPRLEHKLRLYPQIVYQYFIHPSLMTIEEITTPFVPRDSDPPADPRKLASGTLQSGFYESVTKQDLYESKAVFGYIAYDTIKGEMYAEEQHENEEYIHEPRYPGHKPQDHYLTIGMAHAEEEVFKDLAKKYRKFLKKM